jgi:hypothetical protein
VIRGRGCKREREAESEISRPREGQRKRAERVRGKEWAKGKGQANKSSNNK